ncbi:hypothetical protein ABB37_03996 [Leptomonas pyrrhocoris]|uniref:Uncharacterized protein n=1 Tax=Leptomonas pyrrhocoris TaxID=157538 RepID=A0A0M9G401_LEPPY|nr:hypothetical protein ABB37_03996 [Leptomonas pyrrhocoris]KPA81689.1 hypothetical protein ABB37_03996 [Leptomonas pyrrhocoris]|eukprot:XP_015660128.1 hypothetical protein ABB37_03996 [Leptomonas pyrrhocoris]
MYMDILEQEVEALSAEVTRLRLMVHRVTQVMEAPPSRRHGHADPLHVAPPSSFTRDTAPADLQATVDSYKQLLPLIQVLLEQQRSAKEVSGHRSSKKKKSSSHRRRHEHHRRHRSRRSPSSTNESSYTSSSRSHSTSSTTDRSSGIATPRIDISHVVQRSREAPREEVKGHVEAPPSTSTSANNPAAAPSLAAQHAASAAAATERRRPSTVSIEETPSRAEQQGYSSTPTPKSGSVVDRLRAQRGLTSQQEDKSLSTESSEDMPACKSLTRSATTSAATSPSAAVKRPPHGSTSTSKMAAGPAAAKAVAKKSHLLDASYSMASSKLLDAPLASEAVQSAAKQRMDSGPPASLPAEEMGCYVSSPDLAVWDVSHAAADTPAEGRRDGVHPSSPHHGRSTANSLQFSDQGRYSYSMFNSLANSPSISQVADDSAKGTRTDTTAGTSAALEPTHAVPSGKLLPQQTIVMSRARHMSSDSSSSSNSTDDDHVAHTPVVLTTSSTTRPFGSGVVLGARQPISAHSPSSSGAPAALPALGCTIPAPMKGTVAPAEVHANLTAGRHPMKFDNTSESSSSSDGAAAAAAVFQRQQARHAVHEDHRESSFHNYSETAVSSSPASINNAPLQRQLQQQQQQQQLQSSSSSPHQQDFPAALSQDAYSYALFLAQYSAHGSPHPGSNENAASLELSRAVSRPGTARSESHGPSLGGKRGFFASGGYYYDCDFAMRSPSQPSTISNAGAEHGVSGISAAYDY